MRDFMRLVVGFVVAGGRASELGSAEEGSVPREHLAVRVILTPKSSRQRIGTDGEIVLRARVVRRVRHGGRVG